MWRVTQVSGQWVPKHRTGYSKGPTTIWDGITSWWLAAERRCYLEAVVKTGTQHVARYWDTGEQNRSDIGMWWHRVCTWDARVCQANGAQNVSLVFHVLWILASFLQWYAFPEVPKYFSFLYSTVSIRLVLCKPNFCKTHSLNRLSVQLTLGNRP